jgi:hypothetical protein
MAPLEGKQQHIDIQTDKADNLIKKRDQNKGTIKYQHILADHNRYNPAIFRIYS